jgi:hypothetical protein
MDPLIIYSKIVNTRDSHANVYQGIKSFFETFVPAHVHETAKSGFIAQQLMVYYYLPLVYLYFPDKFVEVLSELHIDPINFNKIDYVIDDVYKSRPYLREDEIPFFNDLYKKMIKEITFKYELHYFTSAIIEVYPNKDHSGGHGVTLILSDKNEFIVIDDQNCMLKLQDYYRQRCERIYELSIRDVNGVTMANINGILKSKCSAHPDSMFKKRVTRYCLHFDGGIMADDKADVVVDNELMLNKPIEIQPMADTDVVNIQVTPIATTSPSITPPTSSNNLMKNIMFILIGFALGIIITVVYHSVSALNNKNFGSADPVLRS